jgi:DNA mismatch endonuclease (patch repair protein)
MPDVFTKARRSEVMSRIRGRGNRTTELAMIAFFRRHGITGWRRHRPVFGRPDFVFPKLRLAVFVDGCFWHACPRHCRMPLGNRAFWRAKLQRNQQRDRLVRRTLQSRGWRVLRIWEHELAKRNERRLLGRVMRGLAGKRSNPAGLGELNPGQFLIEKLLIAAPLFN